MICICCQYFYCDSFQQVVLETSTYSLPVDFQVLQKCCANEELFAALAFAPQEALACIGAAVYEVRVPQFLPVSIMLNKFYAKEHNICWTVLLDVKLRPVCFEE